MRITKAMLEKVVKSTKYDVEYEVHSPGGHKIFEFLPNGNLTILKIFGKNKDWAIRKVVSDWRTTPLNVLNAKVTSILQRMTQQGTEYDMAGMDDRHGKIYDLRD